MAVSQPTFKPVVGTGAINKKITNLSVPTADTEVSLALTGTTKGLLIRSRNVGRLQIGFNATESGSNYLTLNRGCVYSITGIEWTSSTIYLQSNIIDTIEIVEYYS